MNDNDVSRWCDFVRGLLPEDESLQLERELETADPATRGFVEMLRRVAAVGLEDKAAPVPAQAVRLAKAIGSLRRYGKQRKLIPFSIVFDSLVDASPAGARDLGPSLRPDRLLSFEAGIYSADLRVEQESDSRYTVIVGQVLRAEESVEPAAEVQTVLSSEGKLLASTVTNELGEFQVRCGTYDALTLTLLVEDERWIELPLIDS